MITELSDSIGGITINGVSYNVFCYADDILLTSTSTTGLQRLINVADLYIVITESCYASCYGLFNFA